MKHTVFLIWIALASGNALAASPIEAVIEAQTNRPGWFVMHITNVSSNSIHFLDVREGSGFGGDFYEVMCERDGKQYTSKGQCYYATGADPRVVEIIPGETYDREIQPGAYLQQAQNVAGTEITVTYRLSDKIKDMWKSRPARADLNLTFKTNCSAMESTNKLAQ